MFLTVTAAADCLPIADAPKHIGQTACVRGKVVKVSVSSSGTHFLNFCDKWQDCPFSAVVFSKDLRQVGDVRTLEGKEIDIHGQIRLYRGKAEVIVRDSRQLKGQAAKLPPIPKAYDVERHGSYSAGKRPRYDNKTSKKKRYPSPGAESIPETEPQPSRE